MGVDAAFVEQVSNLLRSRRAGVSTPLSMFKRILFALARHDISALFIGFAFTYLAPLIPVKRVYHNREVIVFYHPVPFWEIHLLAVPRRPIRSFMTLDLERDETQQLMVALFQAVQLVTDQLGLNDYTLLVNGGQFQDVPQMHFHIAVGQDNNGKEWIAPPANIPAGEHYAQITLGTAVATRFQQDAQWHKWLIDTKPNHDHVDEQLRLIDQLRVAQDVVVRERPAGYTLLSVYHLLSNSTNSLVLQMQITSRDH